MRFDLHHPANRRRPCIVVNPGRGDYVVAGVAVHPEERLLLFQDRNELALALLVPRVILHRASVCPLVLLRRSSDSQTLGDGKNAFIRIDGDNSRLGNVMRQVPPERDINIAGDGCSAQCTVLLISLTVELLKNLKILIYMAGFFCIVN